MTPNQLTPAELMVLKGLALGLGTCHIKSLLALSDSPYRKIQQQLFQKLQAENAYVAVQRAFQLQILIHAEYSDEMVKETALEMPNVFADNVEQDPKNFDKKMVFQLYNLLIRFHSKILRQLTKGPEKVPQKKSHRSGI
ncbi:MAG: hypothetical protein ACPGC5_02650 [Flavobacteriaceae bacterium]